MPHASLVNALDELLLIFAGCKLWPCSSKRFNRYQSKEIDIGDRVGGRVEIVSVSKVVSVSKEKPKLQRPKLVTDQCLS